MLFAGVSSELFKYFQSVIQSDFVDIVFLMMFEVGGLPGITTTLTWIFFWTVDGCPG